MKKELESFRKKHTIKHATKIKLHLKKQLYFVWILAPCTRLEEFGNIFYENGKETLIHFILKIDKSIPNPFFAKGFQILSDPLKKDF